VTVLVAVGLSFLTGVDVSFMTGVEVTSMVEVDMTSIVGAVVSAGMGVKSSGVGVVVFAGIGVKSSGSASQPFSKSAKRIAISNSVLCVILFIFVLTCVQGYGKLYFLR